MNYNEVMSTTMRIDSRAVVRWTPVMLAAMLFCNGAAAQISDTIHPIVSVGYSYDDNLLRLPENYPIEQRSDRMTQLQAGVLFDRLIGRQRLSGRLKATRVTFDHFDQLDYNGKDAGADLAWQVGNHVSGTLGAAYVQTLTPFSDFQNDERNLRTQRTGQASAAWRFHPSWQVRAGVTRNEFEYELLSQRGSNRSERVAEVGFDYLARSGSKVGLVASQWRGSYENPRIFGGMLLGGDYKQNEMKLNVNWLASAVTQVSVLAGYARREYTAGGGRDSGGADGRVSANWAPLGKVRFNAAAWREFAAVESIVATSSLNTGGSLGATWDVSSHLQATASYRSEKRNFEQSSAILGDRDSVDQRRSSSLGLVWIPRKSIQLGITAFQENRSGAALVGTSDYRAKGVSLNATAQF
jgi:exopolysaccharide biosynthesis operon protein EpsL